MSLISCLIHESLNAEGFEFTILSHILTSCPCILLLVLRVLHVSNLGTVSKETFLFNITKSLQHLMFMKKRLKMTVIN